MKSYPRILIYGTPFSDLNGGGITLTNLFRGWPKEKLAVASTGHSLEGLSTEVCDTYYLLGKNEQRWIFPFNLLQREFPSGQLVFDNSGENVSGNPLMHDKPGLRQILVDKVFYPLLQYFGLIHFLSKIHLSKNLSEWLELYKPEVLYLQVATREDILFAIKLCDHLGVPSVIHNMDDWPSTISNKGLLNGFWKSKIDREFRYLLSRMSLCLSISDSMSDEYLKRYQKQFIAFHNPIDTSKISQTKRDDSLKNGSFKVLYTGRIGTANREALVSFAKAISRSEFGGYKIHLDIYSPNSDSRDAKILSSFSQVTLNAPVPSSEVSGLLVKYDLLLLPLDFTKDGLKYAKYSMPTKASEYMMSGSPVLIFAPPETAVSKFFAQNECGYCVNKNTSEEIVNAINFIIVNTEYRNKITDNALRIARDRFDSEKVRNDFQQLIINLVK
jgi:glycosyltransferase involved in cell wall biosynthesis